MGTSKRILVAPLCWGLGHAARCIPLVRELQAMGAEVLLGSDGEALALLRAEFPELPFVELPAYRVRYPSANMIRSIAPQVPHLLRVIQQERRALETIIRSHKINALISDNRYGLYNSSIRCAFLSHQLQIAMPYRWLQWLFNRLNHAYWRKYDFCWIPDVENEPSLAGDLSHGDIDGARLRYIGSLSRFQSFTVEPRYDLLAVLSGPEPQRSRWEAQIIEQAQSLPHLRIGIIGGKPPIFQHHQLAEHLDYYSFLTSYELNEAILASRTILARSGYSTVMDLAQLGCRQVIFVPTPGQTEQEYLARRFYEKGIYYYQPPQHFNLQQALAEVPRYTGMELRYDAQRVRAALEELLG